MVKKTNKIMTALSVRQPWAGLIASGEKTVELRSWSTKYRGPLLIVAAKRRCGDLPTGGSICVVDVVDVRLIEPGDAALACAGEHPIDGFNFSWVLENPRPVCFAPIKGRLGLYKVTLVRAV